MLGFKRKKRGGGYKHVCCDVTLFAVDDAFSLFLALFLFLVAAAAAAFAFVYRDAAGARGGKCGTDESWIASVSTAEVSIVAVKSALVRSAALRSAS